MGHYYTTDGIPRFQVPKVDGTGMKETTITIAKELGLYPSVTQKLSGVLGMGDGLVNWKVDVHLDAAYKVSNEVGSLDGWKEQVKAIAKEESDKAPDLGKRVHSAIDNYFRWLSSGKTIEILPFEEDLKPYIRVIDQLAEKSGLMPDANYTEKVVVNHGTKDAGTLDWRGKGWGGERVYLDWKTQKFKSGKANHYIKWGLQLAQYAESDGGVEGAVLASIAIDTSNHNNANNIPRIDVRFWKNPKELAEMFKRVSDLYFFINEWKIND